MLFQPWLQEHPRSENLGDFADPARASIERTAGSWAKMRALHEQLAVSKS